MKKSFLALLFFCILFQVQSQNKFSAVLSNKILRTASYSWYAVDANTGEVLQESPQKSLVPASVMKIVTTAAALELFGPQYRFKTSFGYSGNIDKSGLLKGDLVIKGGCDPAFYSRYFSDYYRGTIEDWAEKIKRSGIKRVKGDLLIDLSLLENSSIPGGWIWEDIGNYYGAGVSALSYFDNLYEIHFNSPSGEDKPVMVMFTNPVIEGLTLENKVVTSNTSLDLSCVYGAPHCYQQEILGTIPMNRNDFIVKAAAPDAPVMASSVFRKVLSSKGIVIEGKVKKTSRPKQYILLAEKNSPELRQILVPLNQKSLNLFAEHLLREIGRAQKMDPSLEPSIQAVSEFWEHKNINLEGFFPADGSGLSRSNNICPRTLVEILSYMYKGPNMEFFFNSLPLAGVSGTLDNAFKGTPLENNLRAKTGSMKRVRSMAGMFTNQKGKKVIFALIINNYEGAGIGQVMEDFLVDLYKNS